MRFTNDDGDSFKSSQVPLIDSSGQGRDHNDDLLTVLEIVAWCGGFVCVAWFSWWVIAGGN